MDTETEHFFVTAAETLRQAQLGRLRVVVTLASGRTLDGVPDPQDVEGGECTELDDTGMSDHLVIGTELIRLHEVVELSLYRPT